MQTEKEYLTGREISSLRCESVGEYPLPDYNGDVKKILAVKTKCFPTGKFVGDDSLELSGAVMYEVVYLDSENTVTHAEFSTDYDAAVKINSETYVDSDVRTVISASNVRLVGPRKLSVKCSLDSEVHILERRVHAIDGDVFMEYEPETLSDTVDVLVPTFASGEAREIGEELLSIDGAIADEVEVLLSGVEFVESAVESVEGVATVKGEVVFAALVRNADALPRCVTKRVPYSEEVVLPEGAQAQELWGSVELSSYGCTVSPTEEGVSLSVRVSACPKVYGRKNSPLDIVSDAYLKERATENEYADFSYTEHILSERAAETFEFKTTLSEIGVENATDVIYTEAQAKVNECELVDNGVVIKGEIRFVGIAYCVDDNGVINYCPVKFTSEFTKNVNINCQIHDNMRIKCAVDATNSKINIDENNVFASSDLDFFVTLSADKRQRCLGSSYATDEEYAKDDSVITVYYPDPSESLFSIAERFHTSVESIAKSNRLSESVFHSLGAPIGDGGVKKLIIR